MISPDASLHPELLARHYENPENVITPEASLHTELLAGHYENPENVITPRPVCTLSL